VYLPRFPFLIFVSLSLLKQLAKGYVLQGQGHYEWHSSSYRKGYMAANQMNNVVWNWVELPVYKIVFSVILDGQ
jgi:hypothetical protein